MNEAQTKHDLIFPALKASGWEVIEGSRLLLEYRITKGRLIGQSRREKSLSADYVLEYKNRIIGVVEAKKRDSYYTEGVAQVKKYAERLNIRFAYATNGIGIYGIDMECGTEGDIDKYPTPDELWEMTYPTLKDDEQIEITNWKERLFAIPFADGGGTWQLRYYQQNAITKVLEAVSEKKDRILLTLATGTGKTAIAFQIVWKLFNAKWNLKRDGTRNPRILFLVDRNILADQAFNAFSAFPEEAMVRIKPKEIKKYGKVPTNGSVFFTIFQSFMSGANEDGNPAPYFGEYPSDFFDFIIIDECHRGGANDEGNWRGILDYFSPAAQLGLTATPKRKDNVDTYKYFGDPVYIYSLKEGINDGFLTPFKMRQVETTIDEYTYKSDDDVVEGEVESDKIYTEKDFNKIIEIKERENKRVEIFMNAANENEKTIIFCANQAHAALIRDMVNQNKKSKDPNYCVRVTSDDGKIGEQFLSEFQDDEKIIPTILTTSKKLSTGVDAPEVRNIVLMRPINSMIEFKQIIGRGTRLFDNKDYFTVFDFVKAHNHFHDPEWDGEPIEEYTCGACGKTPCVCETALSEPCSKCGCTPCGCIEEPPPPCYVCGEILCICKNKTKIKIKLADGKTREIQYYTDTSFWDSSGKPISARQFLRNLFGELPSFFKSEDELRQLWSVPKTRKKLLEELNEKGYSNNQLKGLIKLVDGEESDLFDVLSYIAYHKKLVPRLKRASRAKIYINDYNPKQQEFLNFVLEQYVKEGVYELDNLKITGLLELKYKTTKDAKNELGDLKSIREAFIGFQKYLYQGKAV